MAGVVDVDSVVRQHLPLVKHVVFQVAVHFPRHVDREELARCGTLGLVEAAHRFDPARGVPFERFAAQRIRGAILDAVRSADWAPRSLRNAARNLEVTRQSLASDLGRSPTSNELAEAMGSDVSQLAELQDRIHRSVVLTLDEQVGHGEGDETLSLVDMVTDRDQLDPSEELEKRELHAYLRDAVRLLPERHQLVIVGYFLESKTSQELARFLGVTESRVSQLRSEALEMLKNGIEAQYDGTASAPVPEKGRVARRKAQYAASISSRSMWHQRLERGSGDESVTAWA